MKKLSLISILIVSACLGQTRINPIQINITITVPAPETIVFFAAANQTTFALTPEVNKEVIKVTVYRNGVRQTDIGKIILPAKNADYTLSTDKKTITFVQNLSVEDTVLIDYWLK